MAELSLNPSTEYKAFQLRSHVKVERPVFLVTGLNGSGKTRLLQSIDYGNVQAMLGTTILQPHIDIALIDKESFLQRFWGHFDPNDIEVQAKTIFDYFKIPINVRNTPSSTHAPLFHGPISFTRDYLDRLERDITSHSGIPTEEITLDHVRFHHQVLHGTLFRELNLATLFSVYAKNLAINEYNEFRSKVKHEPAPFYEKEKFLEIFGPPPWVEINVLLDEFFQGKFRFRQPNPKPSLFNFTVLPAIVDSANNSLGWDSLSSGESTLFWLAVNLFCARYREDGIPKPIKLVLLDEPDASLHPKMVKQMFSIFNEYHARTGVRVCMTTHSPTTVALAEEGSVYELRDQTLRMCSRDAAITGLLDGITQFSINPENRRLVYVESHYDKSTFQAIFDYLKSYSTYLDPAISAFFVNSNAAVADEHLQSCIKRFIPAIDAATLVSITDAINGGGSSSHVTSAVHLLSRHGARDIRGIIDWDGKNRSTPVIAVCGEGVAYTLENLIYDPVLVVGLLYSLDNKEFSLRRFCGASVQWSEWLSSAALIQKSIDHLVLNELGLSHSRRVRMRYSNGMELDHFEEYLTIRGHSKADGSEKGIANIVWDKFSLTFLKHIRKNSGETVMKRIVERVMLDRCEGKLISQPLIDVMRRIQA